MHLTEHNCMSQSLWSLLWCWFCFLPTHSVPAVLLLLNCFMVVFRLSQLLVKVRLAALQLIDPFIDVTLHSFRKYEHCHDTITFGWEWQLAAALMQHNISLGLIVVCNLPRCYITHKWTYRMHSHDRLCRDSYCTETESFLQFVERFHSQIIMKSFSPQDDL